MAEARGRALPVSAKVAFGTQCGGGNDARSIQGRHNGKYQPGAIFCFRLASSHLKTCLRIRPTRGRKNWSVNVRKTPWSSKNWTTMSWLVRIIAMWLPFNRRKLTMIALPAGVVIESIVPSGASAWCQTVRIDARLSDGTVHRYFQKVCTHTGAHASAYTCFVVLVECVCKSAG
jgi:hypothetical protein